MNDFFWTMISDTPLTQNITKGGLKKQKTIEYVITAPHPTRSV